MLRGWGKGDRLRSNDSPAAERFLPGIGGSARPLGRFLSSVWGGIIGLFLGPVIASAQSSDSAHNTLVYTVDLSAAQGEIWAGEMGGVDFYVAEMGHAIVWESLGGNRFSITLPDSSAAQGFLFSALGDLEGRPDPSVVDDERLVIALTSTSSDVMPEVGLGNSPLQERSAALVERRIREAGCLAEIAVDGDRISASLICDEPDLETIRTNVMRPSVFQLAPLLNNGAGDMSRALNESIVADLAVTGVYWRGQHLHLRFEPQAASELCSFTEALAGKPLGLIVDGQVVGRYDVREPLCDGSFSLFFPPYFNQQQCGVECLLLMLSGESLLREVVP